MKSILSLPPVLQEVWSRVYASAYAAELQVNFRIDLGDGTSESEEAAEAAAGAAWEAVRRANGGEMPEEHAVPGALASLPDTDASRLAILKEAIEQPCPVTGEPFFMVLRHPDLGWVPTYGGPSDSWTAPERCTRTDELSRWRYDHDEGAWTEEESMCRRVVDIDAERPEPTDEEMVEALAPIVARLEHGSRWDALLWSEQEERISWARMALREPDDSPIRASAMLAIAAWEAARAWGRK